jgi:hypothetical protein
VSDDRDTDDDSYGVAYLKAESYPDSIHETVSRKRKRRQHPDLRMLVLGVLRLVVVNDQHFFGDMENQKPGDQCYHDSPGVITVLSDLGHDLGENIEADYSEQDAGRETHKQMQSVAISQCANASQHGGDERDRSEQEWSHGTRSILPSVR